jgi:hypothetical protein
LFSLNPTGEIVFSFLDWFGADIREVSNCCNLPKA